jgi:Galactose oxidase, central domain
MMSTRVSPLALAVMSAGAFLAHGSPCSAQPPATSAWQQLSPATPLPRLAAMASAFDPVSGRLVVFGGFDAAMYHNDTWTFDGTTWTKEITPVAPSARAAAGIAYDSVSHKLVLFGGFNGQYLNDTWLWDGATSSWTHAITATTPVKVTSPMVFTDPLNGHANTYGGYSGQFYQLTTYQWTGSDWTQLHPAHSPSARSSAIVANDLAHGNVVLYGGLAEVNPTNTWTWNGIDWHEESPRQQPVLRYDSKADFEPHLGAVVAFGGGSGGADLDDTWEWTGSNWVELQPATPPAPRESFALAFLPALDRIVVAGGLAGETLFHDTWSLVEPDAFTNVGPGIGGVLGAPQLTGAGDLSPGSAAGFTIHLGNAPASTPVAMFVSLTASALPFKGGTFYAAPVLAQFTVATNAAGSLTLASAIPASAPSGTSFVMQAWMSDPTAPQLFAGSNGELGVVP